MNGQSRHQRRGTAAMLLALGMSIAPYAAAQPSPDVGRFYAFGGFALFGPDTNDQLQGERGELGVIGGGGFRFSPLLSFELGVLGAGRRLDTPASAAPAAGTFKDGTLRTTSFRTTSEASTCLQHCADTGPRVTSRSRDTGYHAVVGADYHFRAKDVLAAEFRYLKLNANFDDLGLGNVKAGGSLLWLGYRRYF